MTDTQLVQPVACTYLDRKRFRTHLQIELAAIPLLDLLNPIGIVGDDPGKDIQTASRAFRVRSCRKILFRDQPEVIRNLDPVEQFLLRSEERRVGKESRGPRTTHK